MDKLIDFLIEAKKQTYANLSKEKEKSSRVGSIDYNYKKGDMVYHDTYFGNFKFMGEEVVYVENNIVKWGMNYYGVTFDEHLSEEIFNDVLRPALMKVGEDSSVLSVRGPSRFEKDGYVYTFKSIGNIESFEGIEEIYKEGRLIYKLYCNGGVIK